MNLEEPAGALQSEFACDSQLDFRHNIQHNQPKGKLEHFTIAGTYILVEAGTYILVLEKRLKRFYFSLKQHVLHTFRNIFARQKQMQEDCQ